MTNDNQRENDPFIKMSQMFDQNSSWLVDNLPALWYRFYVKCKLEGFTEEQSLKLVQTWILKDAMNGINGT